MCHTLRYYSQSFSSYTGIYGFLILRHIATRVAPKLYVEPHIFLYHILLFARPKRSKFIPPNTCFKDLINTIFVSVKDALITQLIYTDHWEVVQDGRTYQVFKTMYLANFTSAVGTFIDANGRLLYQFQIIIIFKNFRFHHCFPYGKMICKILNISL